MDQHTYEPLRILFDNKPIDDYCGFSTNEIRHLFHNPFGDSSPLRMSSEISDNTLNSIPFFRLMEELCKIVQRENYIKLTKHGALPVKIVKELYNYKFITDDLIEAGLSKLHREGYIIPIRASHNVALISGILKKVKRKLLLTRYGKSIIGGSRQKFFEQVLETYTTRYNWASNDTYSEFSFGQFGWAFTIFLLFRYGNKPKTKQFYAQLFMKAFPTFIEFFPEKEYCSREEAFINCYILRIFERFVEWFGFVEARTNIFSNGKNDIVILKDALRQVFRFDY